jgi:hypothetical protein
LSQWKNTDDAANSVIWASRLQKRASGKVAIAANNTAMFNNATSIGVFGHGGTSKQIVGQFGAQAKAVTGNTSGEGLRVTHAGWQLRTQGLGPVTGFTVNATAASSGFVTGETGVLSGGAPGGNGTFIAVANATGNLASVSIPGSGSAGGGSFANASSVVVAFNREKYLSSITVTNTPVTFSNTDVITATAVNNFVVATASILTNTIGGFANGAFTITKPGLFGNASLAANITFTVANSTGGASGGSNAVFAAVLSNSSGGSILTPTLGGRAGRVFYETLVAQHSLKVGAGSNTAQLPIT